MADAGSEQLPAAAVTIATINFVDLAGSERGVQAAESGDKEKLRQKEVRHLTACPTGCKITYLSQSAKQVQKATAKFPLCLLVVAAAAMAGSVCCTVGMRESTCMCLLPKLHSIVLAGWQH